MLNAPRRPANRLKCKVQSLYINRPAKPQAKRKPKEKRKPPRMESKGAKGAKMARLAPRPAPCVKARSGNAPKRVGGGNAWQLDIIYIVRQLFAPPCVFATLTFSMGGHSFFRYFFGKSLMSILAAQYKNVWVA